jgi:hypothetical protein
MASSGDFFILLTIVELVTEDHPAILRSSSCFCVQVCTCAIGVARLNVPASCNTARPPKSDYQWTGTVLEADGDHLVVQKGDEKWKFAYDKDTKVTGTLKAGAKVTVKYVMKAASIEAKEEAKKEAPKKK